MSSGLVSLLALAPSLLLLRMLARRDPKRLRSLGQLQALKPWSVRQRQSLGTVVLVPGLALMLAGAWPAFLIWSGAMLAAGWLMVMTYR